MSYPRVTLFLVLAVPAALAAELPVQRSSKQELRALNDLIGSWRATGTPEGNREDRQRGFWTETQSWSWHFKGDDAWLTAAFEKGKYFTEGELHYVPEKDLYRLTVKTPAGEHRTFEGRRKEHVLTLVREDAKTKEQQRLVLSLFHGTRLVVRFEVKGPRQAFFTKVYTLGATKEGVAFAAGDATPECVVSGGRGTRKVTYKGQTYYVCCGGCEEAFKDNPEKYIKEFQARKESESKTK
jgi:YHS domain-containing protein